MEQHLEIPIEGIAPDFTVNYSAVLLSRGSLAKPQDASLTMLSEQVQIDWTDNSGSRKAQATDVAMLVVYNPAKKDAVSVVEGINRSIGTATLTVPSDYVGDIVEVYMAFISADGNQLSDSVHVGSGAIIA